LNSALNKYKKILKLLAPNIVLPFWGRVGMGLRFFKLHLVLTIHH